MADRFFVFQTIGEGSPYMTRLLVGRLRLHIFHRGDGDEDPHDHPWAFTTFPLTSYVEDVTTIDLKAGISVRRETVKAFRFHRRPASYLHRVIGRAPGGRLWPTKIVTLVWRGPGGRRWGFLKHRDGRYCWQAWRDYARGGRHAPCTPSHPQGPVE